MRSDLNSKCEYVQIDQPCSICRDRNLPCTAADKIWGRSRQLQQAETSSGEGPEEVPVAAVPCSNEGDGNQDIPRQPPTPDEVRLGPIDGVLLQFYVKSIDPALRYKVYAITPRHDGIAHPDWCSDSFGHDVFQRFGPNLSTMAVRYAILLFALQKVGDLYDPNQRDLLRMNYKDNFYRAMLEAINMKAYPDVLYASYFTCLEELLLSGDQFGIGFRRDEFVIHLNGFVSALKMAAPGSTHAELLAAKILFANVLHWTMRFSRHANAPDTWLRDFLPHFEAAHVALKSANKSVRQGCHTAFQDRHLDMFTTTLLRQSSGYAISTYHWQPPQEDCECWVGNVLRHWGLFPAV